MSRLRILIPAKPFSQGKSRLGCILNSASRAALCEELLCRTVTLAAAVAPTTVVTPDPAVAARAMRLGARALLEPRNAGLNAALDWARHACGGAGSLLVLPIDLPCVSSRTLRGFSDREGIAIATDRRGVGTNMLLLPQPVVRQFRFAFGPFSAMAHRAEAQRLGFTADTIDLPEAACDLDLPEDYAEFQARRVLRPDARALLLGTERNASRLETCRAVERNEAV
jgi:2-phospho-L-lactate guanylyltransferase